MGIDWNLWWNSFKGDFVVGMSMTFVILILALVYYFGSNYTHRM